MDTFEVLNNLLVKLFNDILDVEEKQFYLLHMTWEVSLNTAIDVYC